jgi:hypothetical protein
LITRARLELDAQVASLRGNVHAVREVLDANIRQMPLDLSEVGADDHEIEIERDDGLDVGIDGHVAGDTKRHAPPTKERDYTCE